MKPVLNLKHLALLLALMAGGHVSAQGGPAPVRVERQSYLMGTVLRAEVVAPTREQGVAAVEAAFAEVRRLESVLSSWSARSELGVLNAAAPGEQVRVTPELMSLLVEAEAWRSRTDGSFDAAVGALVDAWDLRGEGRRPGGSRLAEALRASGPGTFRLSPGDGVVMRMDSAAWLDSGGFGKGAALRGVEAVLRGAGVEAALIDFGGQLLAFGSAADGRGWEVAVADPRDRSAPVRRFRIAAGSVATSAQSERYVDVGGERYGHVVDPRTGRPVPPWGSVTVVAEDPLVADVLSTALLVMGPEAARGWASQRGEGVLLLEVVEGEVVASWNEAFERYTTDNNQIH